MPGNDVPDLLSAISIALTLVVIFFAWRTVREAQKATTEQKQAVDELKKLVDTARQTTDHAATSAEAAERTVELAAAAQEADRKHRQLEQLRAIGRLVIVIRTKAEDQLATAAKAMQLTQFKAWRCMEQAQLESELVGVAPPLPKCRALVGANQAAEVKGAADQANAELRQVFLDLGVPGG
jgi:hypothetical protein